MAKRTLTPEEQKLWQQVTDGDRKLRGNKKETPPPPAAKPAAPRLRSEPAAAPPRVKVTAPTQGGSANIDKNTATRFRKGELAIDATLDLHGYTYDKAQQAVRRFIAAQYERGSRCVIVVTGKGMKTPDGELRGGVLRAALPGWLGDDDCAPYILTFDTAKPKHGGSGACYVLLRRKR